MITAKPTIHLNGTHPRDLYEQLSAAIDALREADRKLGEAMPNGRDYYPQGADAINQAINEHSIRMFSVRSIIGQLEELRQHVADQAGDRL